MIAIKNFGEVTNKIWRGAAPTINDVVSLKKDFGVNKIISLSESDGEAIARTCQQNEVKQIIIPIIFEDRFSVMKLFGYDIRNLLLNGSPTFVHCHAGKDRTGLLIAVFRCKYQGWCCKKAIAEAKLYGFGKFADPKIIDFYKHLIHSFCPVCSKDEVKENDVNNDDDSDNTSVIHFGLDPNTLTSFAPKDYYSWSDTLNNFDQTENLAKKDQFQISNNIYPADVNKMHNVGNSPLTDSDYAISIIDPLMMDGEKMASLFFKGFDKIRKLAGAIEQSYPISFEDKQAAENIKELAESMDSVIDNINKELELIYTPFKNNPNVSQKEIWDNRGQLRNYIKEINDHLNKFKEYGIQTLKWLKHFEPDTNFTSITNAFEKASEDLNLQFERLSDVVKNIDNPDLPKGLVTAIDNIKKESAQLKSIIDTRLISHINDNILPNQNIFTDSLENT